MTSNHIITLLDGGLGQELYKRGFRGEQSLWSANALTDAPEAVQDIHRDFIKAGADVITTNTYCTTPFRLERAGRGDEFEALVTKACELAVNAKKEAGCSGVRIAGCLPPLYASYRADIRHPVEEMLADYRKMVALIAPYVDLFLCETMTSGEEAYAAAKAASEAKKPVWVSFAPGDNYDARLRSGESLAEAAQHLEGIDLEALLVNCCSPETVAPALGQLRDVTEVAIGAYANGFSMIPEPWEAGDIEALGTRRDLGPETYYKFVQDWVDQGASIVGGCCEIGPDHIALLAENLKTA